MSRVGFIAHKRVIGVWGVHCPFSSVSWSSVLSASKNAANVSDYKFELQPVGKALRIAIARWKGTPYSYRVLVFREYFGL
jgi:hypothetical protein